ncbi:Telomerase protein component 1 [Exophiala sideris]|nr:Telomerase protein component 1 [Exophiala sideris]
MASLLRQIVAGPRARHPQAGLDLCYVTDYSPSGVWPKKAYRNPLDQLVAWLDRKHGQDWTIFEFRAEGTGYPDSEVYNRIHHFPWPDHHPPPFAVMPNLMAAMRNWIQRLDEEGGDVSEKKPKRVAVVHCKAGKGRSGTVACSYLISEEGWKRDDALQRFTERRMRTGFGQGVSIPSQLRYVGYVDRWTNSMGKTYVERPVEILEVHIWGLRDGVKAAIEGFVDNGKKIRQFHTFTREEKNIVEGGDVPSKKTHLSDLKKQSNVLSTPDHVTPNSSTISLNSPASNTETVILKPSKPVILPTSDVNIDFERRNKATAGFTMVTSLAHVWFNCYFEGGYEGYDSGVFAIEWEAMDGIKGSYRKGTKSLDRLKVVWRYAKRVGDDAPLERVITEPAKGEPVPEVTPPNWRGEDDTESKPSDGFDSGRPGGKAITMGAMVNSGAESLGKELGLRKSHPDSTNVSRASSMRKDHEETTAGASTDVTDAQAYDSSEEGVKTYGVQEEKEGRQDTKVGHAMETGLAKAAHIVAKMRSDGYDGNHQG